MTSDSGFLIILAFCAAAAFVISKNRFWLLSQARGTPDFTWRLPEIFAVGLIVGFFVVVAVAGGSKPQGRVTLEQLVANLALYGGLILFVLGVLVFRGANLSKNLGLRWGNWRREGLLIVAALFLALPFVYAAQWIGFRIGGAQTELQPVMTYLLGNPGWQGRLAVAVIAIVAAPLAEELIFRGCLYRILKQYGGRYFALGFSALIFAVIHAHLPSLGGLFILAVALALVYEYTGSLWAPILMHALFNGMTVVIALLAPEAFQ